MNNSSSLKISWDRLCRNISEKNVIPVLGNEMYKFSSNGKLAAIETYFTEKLLKKYDSVDASPNTITAAINYLIDEQQVDIRDINDDLKLMATPIAEFPLLNNFLTIEQLFFYVNTTIYGNILSDKLKQTRGELPIEGNFSIYESFLDFGNIEILEKPFVFNIFGTLTDNVAPALKEEEMLEFTTALIGKMGDVKFTSILDALKNKTLLFLGCSQPVWLIRFMFRILSNQRIDDWQRRRTDIIIVNDQCEERDMQFRFLKNYRAITYEGNTEEFVKELAGKWSDWIKAHPPKPKKVFLSYSHKDKAAADRLHSSISTIENVYCWYDTTMLESGDNFDDEIVVNINEADLFIPLISNNSLAGENTYVKREWDCGRNQKVMREKKLHKTTKYLLPVVIDNTNMDSDIIKQYFPSLSIDAVPGGDANDKFINVIKKQLELI